MVIREDKVRLEILVWEKCGDRQRCAPNLANFGYLISMRCIRIYIIQRGRGGI